MSSTANIYTGLTKVTHSEKCAFNPSQEKNDASPQKWLNDALTFEDAWNEVTPINWEYWFIHPSWNRENAAWLFYGARPHKTKSKDIPDELNLKITEFISMATSKELDHLSPSEWLVWGKENNFESQGGFDSALSMFISAENTKLKVQSAILNQTYETEAHESKLKQVLLPIDQNEGKVYVPANAIGKLAIKAAKKIEKDSNRIATKIEVMNLLQNWADDGDEPAILKESKKMKRAVVWVTSTLDEKIYDIDACGKTLEKWNKHRK